MFNIVEVIKLSLSDVKKTEFKENTTYQIYQYTLEDNSIVPIWGANTLGIIDNNIVFNINKSESFNQYRGYLSLEAKIEFYLKEMLKHFDNDMNISFTASLESTGDDLNCFINITSIDIDVEKFIGKLLAFEFEFENTISKIEEKISKLLK